MNVTFETVAIPSGGEWTSVALRGQIAYVQYTRPGSDPLANGATVTVTTTSSGAHSATVLSAISLDANFLLYPRTAVHTAAGAVITGVVAHHVLALSTVKVDVTGGGAAANSGLFFIAFEG